MTDDPILDSEAEDARDGQALARVGAVVQAGRPVPAAGFRAQLRSQVIAGSDELVRRPLGRQILGFSLSGAALLGVAALGLAGIGPLAA